MARARKKQSSRTEDVEEVAPTVDRQSGLAIALDGIVHVLTCGSVDDGKSTLIGRLLWESTDLPEDTRATIARSAGPDGIPDVSLLVDGLLAEREQGITIDIAWRYVDAGSRRIVIIDSPGHEQYTRNMASGASHADVAVMLVDARDGLKVQTRRHAAILDLVGVRHVVLAVNKMDLIDWDEGRFRAIEKDFGELARKFGFVDTRAIPVSAKLGDSVTSRSARMPWYTGPTLLERLDTVPSRTVASNSPFRFPVQTVVRGGGDFRGLAGTVVSGRIAVGDDVIDATSGRQAAIARIVTMDGDLEAAGASRAVVLVLDKDLDISRGAVLCAPGAPMNASTSLEARLVWLADKPFEPGRGLLLRTATDLVPVQRFSPTARLDLATLEAMPDARCEANDIVLASISLGRQAALDRFRDLAATGSFVLVDAVSGATVAGGVVAALRDGETAAVIGGQFRLTVGMLSGGLCAGLSPDDPEFKRRVAEVQKLMQMAGIEATFE